MNPEKEKNCEVPDMVLEKIKKENDIKVLSDEELKILADEIREFLIEKISVTG